MITIPMTISATGETIPVNVSPDGETLGLEISSAYQITNVDAYEGEYEIIPSSEEQILQTDGKMMVGNLKVGKIPNNYGLVTWNGSFLMIS